MIFSELGDFDERLFVVLSSPVVRHLPDLDEIRQLLIARQEERVRQIFVADDPAVARKRGQKPWYPGVLPGDKFWPTYEKALKDAGDLPDHAIEALNRNSDGVIRDLANPMGPPDQVQGLVIGYVQSGKTANFNAVIAKAADRGFRLTIVLAGIHNNLRRQTQKRIEKDLTSSYETEWFWLTNSADDGDFDRRDNPAPYLQRRSIAVVKKNATVLRRLNDWLDTAGPALENCPILLIDDESDQASVNTSTEDDPSTIAGLVKQLASRPHVSYVGYTATPYANVFINPTIDNLTLYPSDFVLALQADPAYFGAEKLFGRAEVDDDDEAVEGLPVLIDIPDNEIPDVRPSNRKADREIWEPDTSGSLRQALLYFLMATAARRARGHTTKHSSMLIHTTRYVEMMDRMHEAVSRELRGIRAQISRNDLDELRELWEEQIARGVAPLVGRVPTQFEELEPFLSNEASVAEVVVDHGESEKRLRYDDHEPTTVIAIGGDTLSRGLTLEGLVVSFFVRESNTYDTLMQMGRWFGYRPDYEDLPRIWMSRAIRDNFRDLALVEEDLRQFIRRNMTDGITPQDLAIAVRTHPTMLIVSPLKMRHARTVNVGFAGKEVQTTHFYDTEAHADLMVRNQVAVRELVAGLSHDTSIPTRRGNLYRDVPAGRVQDFLDSYGHPDEGTSRPDLWNQHIKQSLSKGELETWNVFVRSGDSTKEFQLTDDHAINTLRRPQLTGRSTDSILRIRAITTPSDRRVDLPVGQDRQHSQPLLIVYVIDQNYKNGGKGYDDVIAVGIDFPGTPEPEYMAVVLPERADQNYSDPDADDVGTPRNTD